MGTFCRRIKKIKEKRVEKNDNANKTKSNAKNFGDKVVYLYIFS